MMQKTFVLVALLLITACGSVGAAEPAWKDISQGETGYTCVFTEPVHPDLILAGRKGYILRSQDGGSTWEKALILRGRGKKINSISSVINNTKFFFAATDSGLFFSQSNGNKWSRIYKNRDYLKGDCTGIGSLGGVLYLGTRSGLLISDNKGNSWSSEMGELGELEIVSVTANSQYIFVATKGSLFRKKLADNLWVKVFSFVISSEHKEDSEDEEQAKESENYFSPEIRNIAFGSGRLDRIYMATSNGVYISVNEGSDWQKVSDFGLLSRNISKIFINQDFGIYVSSDSGIFELIGERWQEISLRLIAKSIKDLAVSNSGLIYAACDNGLFRADLKEKTETGVYNAQFQEYLKSEPTIQEAHKAAIVYAEVSSEKISEWRKKAAKKALLPKLDIGIDRDATDLWHWESGSTTKTDDDILRRGRDSINWDIGLSWDLSDIIWNDVQTSIDARSRLMVELREDILDQVTKLYFERIRTKKEIDELQITDRKKRFDKELKLQELTASLDALTGGLFSRSIQP
jgi:hypothetical protein